MLLLVGFRFCRSRFAVIVDESTTNWTGGVRAFGLTETIIRGAFRRRAEVAVVRSGPAAGSSAGDRVPSEAPVSVRRRRVAVPGSHAAKAGVEARAPCRRLSSRSAWMSAPTASTSARSGRHCGWHPHDGCTSPESSTLHSVHTTLGSRDPTCANPATPTHQYPANLCSHINL